MITGSKIRLRAKRLADAQNDYTWQTDPELAQLDASPLQTMPFPQYLSEYTGEIHYPSFTRRQFAIDTLDGKHIGNCTYYGINEKKGEAEIGIIIGERSCWDRGYGADAVIAFLGYIFRRTNLKRIYLKTLNLNIRAQKCFQKCGFTPYGHLVKDGFNFVLMEIYRERWERQQEKKNDTNSTKEN